MRSLLLSPAPAVFSPQTMREISIRRHPILKSTVLDKDSSFIGHFVGRMKVFHEQRLMRPASIRRFDSFNGVEDVDLEDDKSGLKKINLGLAGFEPTVNRMSKWLLAVIFSLVILWKHDAEVMWAAMGSILNSWFSVSLKQMLNQERPSGLRSDPGMPSSHAQSLFFAIAFSLISCEITFHHILLIAVNIMQVLEIYAVLHTVIDWMKINGLTISIGAFTLICGSYLSWLRVSQQLHTINQVLVGAVIGSICGLTWFWIWHEFVLETFVSSIWVQNFVVLASVGLCVTYFFQSLPHWLQDE